jgi:hypothetical protein
VLPPREHPKWALATGPGSPAKSRWTESEFTFRRVQHQVGDDAGPDEQWHGEGDEDLAVHGLGLAEAALVGSMPSGLSSAKSVAAYVLRIACSFMVLIGQRAMGGWRSIAETAAATKRSEAPEQLELRRVPRDHRPRRRRCPARSAPARRRRGAPTRAQASPAVSKAALYSSGIRRTRLPPPATWMVCPEIQLPAGEASQRKALATSSGRPARPVRLSGWERASTTSWSRPASA